MLIYSSRFYSLISLCQQEYTEPLKTASLEAGINLKWPIQKKKQGSSLLLIFSSLVIQQVILYSIIGAFLHPTGNRVSTTVGYLGWLVTLLMEGKVQQSVQSESRRQILPLTFFSSFSWSQHHIRTHGLQRARDCILLFLSIDKAMYFVVVKLETAAQINH